MSTSSGNRFRIQAVGFDSARPVSNSWDPVSNSRGRFRTQEVIRGGFLTQGVSFELGLSGFRTQVTRVSNSQGHRKDGFRTPAAAPPRVSNSGVRPPRWFRTQPRRVSNSDDGLVSNSGAGFRTPASGFELSPASGFELDLHPTCMGTGTTM